MFERFSEEGRSVLMQAKDVALELGSPSIEPVHLLYGCAAVRDETAGGPLRDAGVTSTSVRARLPRGENSGAEAVDPDALRAIGVDYEAVRASVEQNFGTGALDAAPDRRVTSRRGRPPFTAGAKRSLEQALRVAVELHSPRILLGHLLLGLLRLDDESVVEAIEGSGATVAGVSAAALTRRSAAA